MPWANRRWKEVWCLKTISKVFHWLKRTDNRLTTKFDYLQGWELSYQIKWMMARHQRRTICPFNWNYSSMQARRNAWIQYHWGKNSMSSFNFKRKWLSSQWSIRWKHASSIRKDLKEEHHYSNNINVHANPSQS